ncbi:MAG: TRAM domain-containing protein, partial [Verrucomicrobiae bacterium]|nr:TRAM domain-containing protein [Verrucomicrobiae bacterium]
MSDTPTEPPPFQPGERRTGLVDNIAFGGDGVVRLEGFVVFVPFVLPGEQVEVEFTEVRRSFAR